MKRLLLAPLLFSLLVSNSVFAGRPDPKKKLARQQQEEYISICNNPEKGYFSICNKIIRSERDRITNQNFIDTKKAEAQKLLDSCIKYNDPHVCSNLRYKKFSQLDGWIEVTLKQRQILKTNIDAFLKEMKSKENQRDPAQKVVDKYEWTMRWDCEAAIKTQLKDPKSYKAENVQYAAHMSNEHPNAVIDVRISFDAKNSFGGNARSFARCVFDSNGKMVQFPTVVSRF